MKTSQKIARTAILFALAMALSWLESLLPSFIPVPGIKLGLSNIVTMYSLFFSGAPAAFAVAILKSLFVMLTRGFSGGLLSLCGGLVSVGIMLVFLKAGSSKGFVSVTGAVFHNLGQLAGAMLFLQTPVIWMYIPVLIISGIIMGIVTGALLTLTLPAVRRVDPQDDSTENTNNSTEDDI